MYRPAGKPEYTGLLPPNDIQGMVLSSLAKRVSLALISKVISVFAGSVSVQLSRSHVAVSLSRTSEAMVPVAQHRPEV
jgi:hypothetical protein